MAEMNNPNLEEIEFINVNPTNIKVETFPHKDNYIHIQNCYDNVCNVKTENEIKEEIKLEDYSMDITDIPNYASKIKPASCLICNFEEKTILMEDNIAENIKLCCIICYKNYFNEYNIIWQENIYNLCNKCDVCNDAFKNGYSVKRHKCINLLWCKNCNAIFDEQRDGGLHYKYCKNKSYICNICCKSFRFINHLTNHKISHSGDKPFSCKTCSKSFTTFGHLKIHLRIHSGEKPYSCSSCSKSFSQFSALKTHTRIHSGEKPYSCNNCSKSFTTSDHLKTHLRIHSGEKPYSCSDCSKSFTTSDHLKTHLRIHSGEKPYSCNNCSKSFITLGHLKNHLRIHSGEKPYSCNNCSKSFTTSSNLNSHLRVHSGEKPYSCDICFRSFSQSFSLKIHRHKIHSLK